MWFRAPKIQMQFLTQCALVKVIISERKVVHQISPLYTSTFIPETL